MIRLDCARAASLMHGRAAGLSQAHALRLEDHLSGCPDCSARAHLLDGLRELSDIGARPLGSGVRQRAVLSALAAAAVPLQRTAAPKTWLVPSLCGAVLAAAVVVFGVVRHPELSVPGELAVLSGQLEHSVVSSGSGGVGARTTALATDSGAVVVLAHATVELRARTRARWDAQSRELHLDLGSAVSDVDPARHQSFGVVTNRFRALVLGTRFEVSLERVSVTRGRVRVEAPDGTTLAILGAGETYACAAAPCLPRPAAGDTPSPPTAQVAPANPVVVPAPGVPAAVLAPAPAAQPAAVLAPAQPAAVLAPGQPAVVLAPGQPARVRMQPMAAAVQLEEARLALARRDLPRARSLVADVLGGNIDARQRAEALTLRAECALVTGDLAGAAAGYRVVADRFARLPAGENAAFAGARVDADRLSGERAQHGLVRYLARYPHGRFVREAETRLRELRSSRDHLQP